MHILILPSEYFVPKNLPSAGIFQLDQAKILNQKRNNVGVLSLKPAFSFKELIFALLNRPNAYTRGISKQSLIFAFLRTLVFPKTWLLKTERIGKLNVIRNTATYGLIDVKNQLKKNEVWKKQGRRAFKKYVKMFGKPDVIHAHNLLHAGLVAQYISVEFHIPYALTEHSSAHIMNNMSESEKKFVKNGFGSISNLSFVSLSLANDIKVKYGLKNMNVTYLPNLMDETFEEMPPIFDKLNGEIVFLNIANLIELKGQLILIESFTKSFKGNKLLKLRIGGDGYLKPNLRKLVVSLGMEAQIELLGALSREEVLKEMNKANIFVLSSYYETFGVVLIEALAMGCPIVATKCGGPESIVNGDNGILVKPKDIEDLSRGLLEIYDSYASFSPRKIRSNVIEQFGKEAFYRRLFNIYQNTIDDHNY